MLLHRSPDSAYSVSAITFPPGRATPIHDHKTWGVVGVWRGEEQEERFERIDDGSRAGQAELKLVGATTNAPGTVTALVPPHNDIHRVKNMSDRAAFSIHVYGRLAGACQVFDLESGAVITWRSDPLAASRAWGTRIDLRRLLGLPGATSEELIDEARRRLTATVDITPRAEPA